MPNPYWTKDVPIYVTREYSGEQGSWFVAGWLHLSLLLLFLLNAVGWGIVGVVTLISLLVGLF